jgi:hypothetical protein
MSDNVENAVFEILKKIQGDLTAFRASVDKRFEAVDARFENIEAMLRGERRDNAGAFLLTRTMFGDLNARVTDLEHRIDRLEDSKHPSS